MIRRPFLFLFCCKELLVVLPETNSLPLKISHPKRTFHLSIIDFQGRTVSFREGNNFVEQKKTVLVGSE